MTQDTAAAERSAHVTRGDPADELGDARPWFSVLIRDAAGTVVRRFHFRAEDATGWQAELAPGFHDWPPPPKKPRQA